MKELTDIAPLSPAYGPKIKPSEDGLYFCKEIRHNWTEPTGAKDDDGNPVMVDRSLYVGHALYRPDGSFLVVSGSEQAAKTALSRLNAGGKAASLTMEPKRVVRSP